MNPICPYCGAESVFESTARIYGGRYYGMAYICRNYPKCDSYVGVHRNTRKPLGRMADAELRYWKKRCHALIDPFWKGKAMSRSAVYRKIQEALGMNAKQAHIGKFDVDECKRLIQAWQ